MKTTIFVAIGVITAISAWAGNVVTTNEVLEISEDTTFNHVTNVYTALAAGYLRADLTLDDHSFVRLIGADGANKSGSFKIGDCARDVTLTMKNRSAFCTTFRNSKSSVWANAGVMPPSTTTYMSHLNVIMGTLDGAYGSTGKAKIVLTSSVGNDFGDMCYGSFWAEKLTVNPSITAGDDGYVDILELNAAAGDTSYGTIANIDAFYVNHSKPVRILFNGGQLYFNNATRNDQCPFTVYPGSKLILEGNDNCEVRLYKQFTRIDLTSRVSGEGELVFRGKNVRFVNNGYRPDWNKIEHNYQPWRLSAADNIKWEHTGTLFLGNYCWLQLTSDDLLPFGPTHGAISMQPVTKIENRESTDTNTNAWWSCIDLRGTSQRVNSILSSNTTRFEYFAFITNSTPTNIGTVRFGTCDDDAVMQATCWPGVNVSKEGTGHLSVQSSRGPTFSAAGGTTSFDFVNSAIPNIFTNVTAATGTTLNGSLTVLGSFTAEANVTANELFLTLGTDATIAVAAGSRLVLGTLAVGDTSLDKGVYTPATATWLAEGSGEVEVLLANAVHTSTGTYTWKGGSADDSLEAEANWNEEGPLDFASGLKTLDFSAGTAQAVVSGTPMVYGLDFGSRTDAFELKGEGELTLYDGGITANGTGTTTISVPTTIGHLPQTWRSTLSALHIKGGITAPPYGQPLTFDAGTAKNAGKICLDTANPNLKVPIVFAPGSYVEVNADDALGTGDEPATFIFNPSASATSSSETYLLFKGDRVVNRPIRMRTSTGRLQNEGTTLTFNKPVTTFKDTTTGTSAITVPANASLIFAGGFTLEGVDRFFVNSGGNNNYLIFRNQPFVSQSDCTLHPSIGNTLLQIRFEATGNTWTSIRAISGRFACGVANALPSTGWIIFGRYDWVGSNNESSLELDLEGHDQELAGIVTDWKYNNDGSGWSATRTVSVTSAKPATITFRAAANDIGTQKHLSARFHGAAALTVDLDLAGSHPTQVLIGNGQSDTTGPLTVKRGTLAFERNAGWAGSTNVTVCGTGVLKMADAATAGTAFGINGADTTLYLEESGKLDIPADGVVTTRCCFVEGQALKRGDYDATSFPAHFTANGGKLHVRRNAYSGTRIFLR